MVIRLFGVLLVLWSAATALAADRGAAPSSVPAATDTGSKQTAAPSQRLSDDDGEVIRNLDMIEQLELLDTLEAIGALKTLEPSEEEF
jgi:hypothetical protein